METPLPDPTSPQIISLNVNPFNIVTLGLKNHMVGVGSSTYVMCIQGNRLLETAPHNKVQIRSLGRVKTEPDAHPEGGPVLTSTARLKVVA